MYCPQCGTPVDNGNRFCPHCGAPLDGASSSEPTTRMAPQAEPETAEPAAAPKSKTGAIFIACVLAAAVTGAIVASLLTSQLAQKKAATTQAESTTATQDGSSESKTKPDQSEETADKAQNEQNSSGTNATKQESQSSTSTSETPFFCTADDYGVICPDAVAGKLSSHYSYGNTVISYGNVTVAIIESESVHVDGSGTELRNRVYGLASVDDPSTIRVKCHLLYVNSDGNNVHWGDGSGTDLAVERLLGISAEEFLSYIKILYRSSYTDSTWTLLSDDNASSSGTAASQPSPFWGVWVGAFKSEAEAQTYANEWSAKGFPATVYLTTDWSNLNPEPWYVVAAGSYASEGEAYNVVGAAQSAGQSDAYVKYSGDYIG